MASLKIKRGTRAQVAAAAAANGLAAGELYLITDEERLAVGTAADAWAPVAGAGEGLAVPWVKRLATPRIAGDMTGTALGALTLGGQREYYIPLAVPRRVTLSGLRISVASPATGDINLGIYGTRTAGDGSEEPGDRIAALTTTLSSGSSGDQTGSFATDLTLVPGRLYWAALICSARPTLRAILVASCAMALGRISNNTAAVTHLYASGTGSTLPASAGSVSAGTGSVPAIYLMEV